MPTRTTEEKSYYANACRYAIAGRIYVIDIDTHEELAEYQATGSAGCYGIRDGVRCTDTRLDVEVVDHDARIVRKLTAGDFPGRRVAIKEWFPAGYWKGQPADERNVEWYFLCDERNGWQGNEADNGALTRSKLGRAARKERIYS